MTREDQNQQIILKDLFKRKYSRESVRNRIKSEITKLYRDPAVLEAIEKIKNARIKHMREMFNKGYSFSISSFEENLHELENIKPYELMTIENLYLIARGRSNHTMPDYMIHSKALERIIKWNHPDIMYLIQLSRADPYVVFVYSELLKVGIDSEVVKEITTNQGISYNDYNADYRDLVYEKSRPLGIWIDRHWKKIHPITNQP